MQKLHFALIGGDKRQLWLARHLAQDGHAVTTVALPKQTGSLADLARADVVLLPMPITAGGETLFAPLWKEALSLTDCLDILNSRQRIFAGRVDTDTHRLAQARKLTIRDYVGEEDLTIANAVPTAEGALQLAMEALPITLHHSRVLITGFGRVGQCTADRFASLGAQVTVCARSPGQLALADSLGYRSLPLDKLIRCSPQDLVINTVPTPLFHRDQLLPLGQPVLLELASLPGGFDMEAVDALGLYHIPAPGLPGKVAPATAARAIQSTLYRLLEEGD